MTNKLFWWGPADEVSNTPARLRYVAADGFAEQEHDPQFGPNRIEFLLKEGYREISWQTARAMGAPV